MAASERDSVISTTSSGSVERVEFELRNDSLDGDGANRYTVDYASTEALLKEQMKTTDKNRRKIKRLKTNLCLLIVFLVNIQAWVLNLNKIYVKGDLPAGCSGVLWVPSLGTLEDEDVTW